MAGLLRSECRTFKFNRMAGPPAGALGRQYGVVGGAPIDRDVTFAHAYDLLSKAREKHKSAIAAWDLLRSERPFGCHVVPDQGIERHVVVTCTPSVAAHQTLQLAAIDFASAVKVTMDEAVFAAANAVSGRLLKIRRDQHLMPLFGTPQEFDELVGRRDYLWGLRPDQIQVLRTIQPFTTGPQGRSEIGRLMQTLFNVLALDRDAPAVCAWLSDAQLQIRLNGDVSKPDMGTIPALRLPLSGSSPLATVRVPAIHRTAHVDANPGVAIDLIFNVEPWPADPDDNATHRSVGLLRVAETLIEALEGSVALPPLIAKMRAAAGQRAASAETAWLPVTFDSDSEETRVRDGLAGSDLGLASYRDPDGQLVLLQIVEGQIVGREVPEARVPVPEGPRGPGVERASLEAAALWGLPDFVYRPRVLSKGSGIREVGDGTIITGGKGIALQVKARESTSGDPAREAAWLNKKATQALRQAYGTIRTFLRAPQLALENLRGREVALDGTGIEWLPVVVLDHDDPPEEHHLSLHQHEDPGVVLLRRDWEFLWDQLRSASAVVDYLHRVSGTESPPLGSEPTRYLELALADAEADSAPGPEWTSGLFAHQPGGPVLPRDLASAQDATAHAMFNEILDDIANTDFTGDETTRLRVLGLLDRVPVTQRSELGRLLLSQLDAALIAAPDSLQTNHRTMMLDDGRLHVGFSVFSTLTGYFRSVYEDWLVLRRLQILEARGGDPGDVWTVGVLLTPKPDGTRLWDTTVLATNGVPELDVDHRSKLEKLWPIKKE